MHFLSFFHENIRVFTQYPRFICKHLSLYLICCTKIKTFLKNAIQKLQQKHDKEKQKNINEKYEFANQNIDVKSKDIQNKSYNKTKMIMIGKVHKIFI